MRILRCSSSTAGCRIRSAPSRRKQPFPSGLLWHSSTAVPGYLLPQPQLAAAVAGPVRILPQFESFYRDHLGMTQVRGGGVSTFLTTFYDGLSETSISA